MAVKRNSFLNTIASLVFVLVSIAYFFISTSEAISINIISYIWPLVFLIGIVFGGLVLKNFKSNSIYDNILGIIVTCLCFSSFGFYSFFFFLGKIMGG